MVNRDIMGRLLYQFENEYFEDIKDLDIFELNAWQIVKYPLFWELIMQDEKQGGTSGEGKIPGGKYIKKLMAQFKKIPELIQLSFSLIRIYAKARRSKQLILFYGHSADKGIKNEKGQYYNSLIDPFIINGIVTSYIYVETSLDGKYKTPAVINIDFKVGELLVLSSFIRMFSRHQMYVEKSADRLYELLRRHFSDAGIDVRLSQEFFKNTMERFYSEYKSSVMLLRIIRPELIITSELLGRGMLAAAAKFSITSIDLQHGLIDRYHSQYIYVKKMTAIKNKLVIPSYIGVFGNLQKDVLLQDEFWSEREVVVLGNSRIQLNREKYAIGTPVSSGSLILIPTQSTAFRELKTLLEGLIALEDLKFKIILKIHPLEPQKNIQVYESLAGQKPEFISIATKESNTYEIMMKCRVIVGFDSTVLLEAVSMQKPCVTLTTPTAPRGIHEFYSNNELEDAIKSVRVNDIRSLIDLINFSVSDSSFYNEWVERLSIYSDRLYAKDYIYNCKEFINKVYL